MGAAPGAGSRPGVLGLALVAAAPPAWPESKVARAAVRDIVAERPVWDIVVGRPGQDIAVGRLGLDRWSNRRGAAPVKAAVTKA